MVRGGRRRVQQRPDETSVCARALANLMPDRITERMCRQLPQWLQRNSRVVPMAGPQYNFIKVQDGYVMHVQHLLPPLLEETPPQQEDTPVVVETVNSEVVDKVLAESVIESQSSSRSRSNSSDCISTNSNSVTQDNRNCNSSTAPQQTQGENEVNKLLEEYGLTVFTKDTLFVGGSSGGGLEGNTSPGEGALRSGLSVGNADAEKSRSLEVERLNCRDLSSIVETSKDDRFVGVESSSTIESVLNTVTMCADNIEIESVSNTEGCEKCTEPDCKSSESKGDCLHPESRHICLSSEASQTLDAEGVYVCSSTEKDISDDSSGSVVRGEETGENISSRDVESDRDEEKSNSGVETCFYSPDDELKPWNVDECVNAGERIETSTNESDCDVEGALERDGELSDGALHFTEESSRDDNKDTSTMAEEESSLEEPDGTVAKEQCVEDVGGQKPQKSSVVHGVDGVQVFSQLKLDEVQYHEEKKGYDNQSFEMWDEEDRAAIMSARRANKELKEKLLHIARLPPLLFFLHGVGGSSSTWAHQLKYFQRQGYEVVAPDLLGHGLSSAPNATRPYKFKHLLRNVFLIFDLFVHPHRRVAIIAHSYGCSFAAALARHRASNVILLILLGSGGPSPLIPNPDIDNSCWLLTSIVNLLKCGCRREALYVPRGKCFASTGGLEVPSYVIDAMIKGQDWPEGDAAFHRRVLVPTLLLYGMKDTLITLIEQCEMEKAIPRANLEIFPSCGHLLMQESPEQVCAKVHRFLKKWDHISLFSETSLRHRGAT